MRILFIGNSGSGKSFLMESLASKHTGLISIIGNYGHASIGSYPKCSIHRRLIDDFEPGTTDLGSNWKIKENELLVFDECYSPISRELIESNNWLASIQSQRQANFKALILLADRIVVLQTEASTIQFLSELEDQSKIEYVNQ